MLPWQPSVVSIETRVAMGLKSSINYILIYHRSYNCNQGVLENIYQYLSLIDARVQEHNEKVEKPKIDLDLFKYGQSNYRCRIIPCFLVSQTNILVAQCFVVFTLSVLKVQSRDYLHTNMINYGSKS